jgi:recombinational DNA repair protein RecT
MGTDLILPAAKNELAKYVSGNIHRIVPLLNTGSLDRQQFAAAVIVACNELKEGSCTPESVLVSAAHAAMVGIVPGRMMKLAYFVPRKLRRSDPKARCNLEISYQGYINLATRNEYLKWVYADLVLQGEEFFVGVRESRPVVEHKVPPDRVLSAKAVRDRLVGAYCLYETVSGGVAHRYQSRQEINQIEERGGPLWKGEFYPAMVRKTPVRAAANYWRLTSELSMALRLDEQGELGEPQDLGANLLPPPSGDKTINLGAMDEEAEGGTDASD